MPPISPHRFTVESHQAAQAAAQIHTKTMGPALAGNSILTTTTACTNTLWQHSPNKISPHEVAHICEALTDINHSCTLTTALHARASTAHSPAPTVISAWLIYSSSSSSSSAGRGAWAAAANSASLRCCSARSICTSGGGRAISSTKVR